MYERQYNLYTGIYLVHSGSLDECREVMNTMLQEYKEHGHKVELLPEDKDYAIITSKSHDKVTHNVRILLS